MAEKAAGNSQLGERSPEEIAQQEKTNFFHVCLIVVENISMLLRHLINDLPTDSLGKLCEVKAQYKKQEDKLKNKGINDWDTSLLARVILSENHTFFMNHCSASISRNCYETKNSKGKNTVKVKQLNSKSNDFNFKDGSIIYLEVSGKIQKVKVENCTSNSVTLENSIPLDQIANEEVAIYYCGERWHALSSLRNIRNDDLGHIAKGRIPSAKYKEILAEVKEHYTTLMAPKLVMDCLQRITEEQYNMDKCTETAKQWRHEIDLMKQYCEKEFKRCDERIDQVESKVIALQATVVPTTRIDTDGPHSTTADNLTRDKIMKLFGTAFPSSKASALGTYLGIPSAKLKEFTHNHRGDCEGEMFEVLDYWLQVDEEASRAKLAEAVKDCGYGVLAKKIRE